MLKRFWICTIKHQHQWNVTEAEVRRSVFRRADCELCGEVIDATKLVALVDRLRYRGSDSRVRDIAEGMMRGFKKS